MGVPQQLAISRKSRLEDHYRRHRKGINGKLDGGEEGPQKREQPHQREYQQRGEHDEQRADDPLI